MKHFSLSLSHIFTFLTDNGGSFQKWRLSLNACMKSEQKYKVSALFATKTWSFCSKFHFAFKHTRHLWNYPPLSFRNVKKLIIYNQLWTTPLQGYNICEWKFKTRIKKYHAKILEQHVENAFKSSSSNVLQIFFKKTIFGTSNGFYAIS